MSLCPSQDGNVITGEGHPEATAFWIHRCDLLSFHCQYELSDAISLLCGCPIDLLDFAAACTRADQTQEQSSTPTSQRSRLSLAQKTLSKHSLHTGMLAICFIAEGACS